MYRPLLKDSNIIHYFQADFKGRTAKFKIF